ncbi:phage antirepressor N-terminal domain-containing protein [Pectobacterium carotovorum]|uniref:phage antirepressor N-terminal domain-containing protein n=1 Tax=Pectobacterium carotovorum TaxID=554 RepID=UPI0030170F20
MSSIAILEAVNTTAVQFHGQPIITAMVAGVAYVAMRPIVENIGVDWSGQMAKLKTQREKFGCRDISTPTNGGVQNMLCIPLRKLNGWLFSINHERVRADIKDKLIQYQEECFTVLHSYWTKGEAVNPRKVRQSTATQLIPLRQTAERLITTGIGHIYPDIWKLVHDRFDVEHIHQLQPAQIKEAVAYLDGLEGEFIGKMDIPPAPATPALTPHEINKLVWLWDYANRSQAIFRELKPIMQQLQSQYYGKCFDYGYEFSSIISLSRDAVLRLADSVDIHAPDGPTNLSAWIRLKNNDLPAKRH